MNRRKAAFHFRKISTKLRSAGCVFAEEEARLLVSSARTPGHLSEMIQLRTAGEPLEYVIGWAEFCGLQIKVSRNVFVPRRRTEFLVHQAAALLDEGAIVVDLCCGSGAIGAAIASKTRELEVHATDINGDAVRCAEHNLSISGGRVYQGDLYDPLPDKLKGRVHLIAANAPYVPTEMLHLLPGEARVYEAREALDGGDDGLVVQRRIAAEAQEWLVQGGRLIVETSQQQTQGTAGIFMANGLTADIVISSELEAAIVIGKKE